MIALAAPPLPPAQTPGSADGRLVTLQLRVARRADALARDSRLGHLSDRKLWLRAELEVCEYWEREAGLLP